jgi:hypothetical protein
MRTAFTKIMIIIAVVLIYTACGTSEKEPAGALTLPVQELELAYEVYQDDDFFLARPMTAQFGPSGNVYVIDNGTNKIEVFNPDGEYLYSVGGEGSGPGEFNAIMRVMFNENNNLLAYDGRNRSISTFMPGQNGYAFQESIIVQSASDRFPNDVSYVGNGMYVASFRNFRAEDVNAESVSDVHLIDREGMPTENALFQIPAVKMIMMQSNSQTRMFMAPLYSPRGILTSAGDGYIATVYTGDGQTVRYTMDGTEARRFNMGISAEVVTDEDRAAFDNADEDIARTMRRNMPDVKPAIAAVVQDTDGKIWARPERRGINEWIRFDHNGNPELRISLPQNVRVTHASADKVLGVIANEARVVGYAL